MHKKLSITGDIDSLAERIPKIQGIKAEKDDKTLTFSAASPDVMVKFKRSLAIWLSNLIIENYEVKYIEKAIKSNYWQFNANERREILNQAVTEASSPLYERKKDLISSRLYDYLTEADRLSIEGFINFRLKEYKESLTEAVDKAVDHFLTQREYNEFVNLLRYFVQMQEPREPLIHIVASRHGSYYLYNESLYEITNQCITEFIDSVGDIKVNFDDMLISSLITLAPLNTVVHNRDLIKNKEVLDTISKVFKDSVTYCEGCPLCQKIF